MGDVQEQVKELLRQRAEAAKHVVDRECDLLVLLLTSKPDEAVQTYAQLPAAQLLTIEVVAERLGVCVRTIRDLVRQEGFPDRRIGKTQRFDWAEVEAWTKRHRDKLEKKR